MGTHGDGVQMPADDPPASTDKESAITLGELDDEGLLAALQEVIGRHEPVPGWSADLAKSSYGLREADAELAALVSDSGLAATRSVLRAGAASRLAVFESGELIVEIEIERAARADSWRLTGQLTPAASARIQVRRQQAEAAWVDADDRGRFSVDHLPAGPLSLVCLRHGLPAAVTEWIVVG
jgi:hypothetical protein